MSFYGEMAQTANDLLKEFGQLVSISRRTAGAYDPATGAASVTATTITGFGAVFDYKSGAGEIDGTLIQAGDKRLLLSGSVSSPPQVDDVVTANGLSYVVKSVKDLNPAGTALLYECLLRR